MHMIKGLSSYPALTVVPIVWVFCLLKNSHKTNKYTQVKSATLWKRKVTEAISHRASYSIHLFLKYKGKCPLLSHTESQMFCF